MTQSSSAMDRFNLCSVHDTRNIFSDITKHYTFLLLCELMRRTLIECPLPQGPFKCYVTQWGVGVSHFLEKNVLNEDLRFNVTSVTRRWWVSNFQKKALHNNLNTIREHGDR